MAVILLTLNIAKELLIGLRKPWDCVFVGFVLILTKIEMTLEPHFKF